MPKPRLPEGIQNILGFLILAFVISGIALIFNLLRMLDSNDPQIVKYVAASAILCGGTVIGGLVLIIFGYFLGPD